MSAALQSAAYPAAIEQKLRRIRRRQCALAAARAVLLGAAALLAAMLIAMTIDWCFTLFSTTVRMLLTVMALSAAAATLLITGIRPVFASLGLRRAAGDVDQVVPQLEERWTTVASFAELNCRPHTVVGKAMLQQVTSEAVAMGRIVEPAKVAGPKRLQRAASLLAAASVLAVVLLAVNWPHHRILLQRFWSPLADVTATQVESVTGDRLVPRGEPVDIVVRTSGLPRARASISLVSEATNEQAVPLTASDDQPEQFTYFVAALESSFRYRVQAGDGRTRWHTITAIDRPVLADVKVTLSAPRYVDRPVYEKDYLPSHVQAVQGSHLRLEMRPEAIVKSFELVIGRAGKKWEGQEAEETDEQRVALVADRDGWYCYEAILEEDVTLRPQLVSPHELVNEDAHEFRIRVLPDRAPVARVISPTDEMAVSMDEVIEVKFEAHDDHGIAKAELVVYEESLVEGEPPTILSVEEVPLGEEQNAPHIMATAELDLAKYNLREGSSVSYAIRVTDNRIAMQEVTTREETQPAGDSEEALDQSRPASEETPNAGQVARSDGGDESSGDDESSSERPSKDKVALTETPQVVDEPLATPSGDASPGTGADVAASTGNSELKGKIEPAATEPSKADIASVSGASPSSKASSAADQQSPEGTSQAARSDAPHDMPLAQATAASAEKAEAASDALPKDSAPPKDSAKLASAAAPENAIASKSGSDAEAEAGNEVPARDEAESQTAASDSSASQPQGTNAAVARQDDQQPRENQAPVTGNLASMNRRPHVSDDLRGQFTESNRLRLKIEQTLVSAAEPGMDREKIQMKIRQRLEQIDRELAPAEEVLASLVETASQSGIADPQIQKLNGVDLRLAKVEGIIAELRNESKETPYAFAGLHMVEIATAHITPARDRVFALVRQPDVDTHSNVAEALHHVSRARELLAELLVRYERVLRDERLADAIEETAEFYEVYVENLHRFLRAQSKPNPNPLQRKMAIVEVDQAYLDRLREVTEMRRDLMAEFARMLSDDPRLLSKYMDVIKRRQTSLRDRLTELHERQEAVATELSGWLRVDETQRDDVWMLAAEIRLQDIAPLAQEASQLEERTASQFPLALDPQAKDSTAVLNGARQLAVEARMAAEKARRLLRDPFDENIHLTADMDEMAYWLSELDAALEQLAFHHPGEETADYGDKRLAENRSLFERVAGWIETASHLQTRQFHGLAKVDQRQLAFRTELLRIDMEGIDQQLEAQFRGEVPASVTALADELKHWMETITFNQAAATFELESERLSDAETQQALALEGFARAEDLFEQIRRQVIEELDQIDPPDPNIADLEDPTLDELLEQLEREPDLNALLGLPNRPQNLRVMSDFFASSEGDAPVPEALEQAARQARQRAKNEEQEARRRRPESDETDDLTEQQWQQIADAEQAREKLQAKIEELKRMAADPQTDPEQAEKLRQMAAQLEQMQQQLAGRPINKEQWEELVRSDQMQAILRAAALGEPLPSSQWNQLMSSLDDGLWQVRRRTPPEDFRQAIQQYQERIRKLTNLEAADARP